jgi:putative acetyltransferase
MTSVPQLRRATPADSAAALALVRSVLAEYGLGVDPIATDADLADLEVHYFARGGDFVVLIDDSGRLVGTCGLFPLGEGVVELRKMYLVPTLRGQGQGRRLLDWALTRARELGFRRITLETAAVLKEAVALYERNGFRPDCSSLHSCRCDTGYARDL